jgi:2-polyprenyl-3-methyl-5-hydroxy-6-metoxy-1,4-benzoquinol methylase
MEAHDIHSAVYGHSDGQPESESYLFPELLRLLKDIHSPAHPLFEVGTGSGWTANRLGKQGYKLIGIEPSIDGLSMAQSIAPNARIESGSAYDDLAFGYGKFRTIFALEVIEHLYSPRIFVRRAYDALEDGGYLILSTPFHGYWKNLLLAITGKMDGHFTALWDHGHIKFWSKPSLTILLKEAGFRDIEFSYAGRFYPISKSFFARARR